MAEFLYIFGYETSLQRRNNSANGWDDENSHAVLIDAPTATAALEWGNRIAQRYIAQLHEKPEVDWEVEGYASFVEDDRSRCTSRDWPRVELGEYPDFSNWLRFDRI